MSSPLKFRSVPHLIEIPEHFDRVETGSHPPVDSFLAFLSSESGDPTLDIGDVVVSTGTIGRLRQATKLWLQMAGLPAAALEVMRLPTIQPTLPPGFAMLRPVNDRYAARKSRKAGGAP